MFCFVIALLLLVSFAFAIGLTPHDVNVVPSDKGLPKPTVDSSPEPEDMTSYCFFGEYPSASCRFHCYMKELSAFCNEEGVCQCRDGVEERKPQLNLRPSVDSGKLNSSLNSSQAEEEAPHLMFYILDLTSLFDGDNTTESTPLTPVKPLPTTVRSWTSPHILAILVLVFLTVLVLLEIVVCCKRRHTKLINIRPVLTPPACEKAPIG